MLVYPRERQWTALPGSHPPLVNGWLGCPGRLYFGLSSPCLQMGTCLLLLPERTERCCLCLPDSSTYRNASCLYFWQPLVDLDGGQQLATQPLWVFNQQFSKCTCTLRAHANPAWPLCTAIAKTPLSTVALVCFLERLQSGLTTLKKTG